jgi:hypothetical protein
MNDDDKVWRYLSFSRFLWMMQRRQLWLSRADKLDDPWELALTGEEISHLMMHAPIRSIGVQGEEPPVARIKRITEQWRTTTYINCWCALPHESHALWRVYCGPKEGVAIQSTWGRLSQLAGNLMLLPVDYTGYQTQPRTPNHKNVAGRKRQMFHYENEVRIIARADTPNPSLSKGEFGCQLRFDPASLFESIVVHPEADGSFHEAVFAAVDTYASDVRDLVRWSDMREPPPVILAPGGT